MSVTERSASQEFDRFRVWCKTPRAGAPLVKDYFPSLYQFLKYSRDPDTARSLAISAFKSTKELEALRDNYCSFRSMLFAQALSLLKQDGGIAPRITHRPWEPSSAHVTNSTVSRRHRKGLRALKELPHEDALVVRLYRFHGLSLQELADVFQITINEVNSQLRQSWKRMNDHVHRI